MPAPAVSRVGCGEGVAAGAPDVICTADSSARGPPVSRKRPPTGIGAGGGGGSNWRGLKEMWCRWNTWYVAKKLHGLLLGFYLVHTGLKTGADAFTELGLKFSCFD